MRIPPHRTRDEFARELGGNVPWLEPSDVHLPMDADVFGYTHLTVRTSNTDQIVNFGASMRVIPSGGPLVEASVEFLAFADGELLRIEATYEGYVGAPPRGRWCRYRVESAPPDPHEVDPNEVRADEARFDAAVEEIERG